MKKTAFLICFLTDDKVLIG